MKVKEIMTQSAVSCGLDTNVGRAVELMWNRNVGMLPVVDSDGKLMGVVTDRDICIAMGTRNRLPGDLTVGEIAIKKVFTCKPNEDVHEALYEMGNHQVRRLPVINDQGVPQGVLSMDDLIFHSEAGKLHGGCELSSEEVASTLKKVYRLQQPVVPSKVSKAAVH
jgi:CBS-domain-containing membrane protein